MDMICMDHGHFPFRVFSPFLPFQLFKGDYITQPNTS